MNDLQNFDQLWDYRDPAATRDKFESLLPEAATSVDLAIQIELRTQIARTHGLQRRFEEAHAVLNAAESMLEEGQFRPRIRVWLERGRVFNSAGSPEQARPLFQAAYELALQAEEEYLAVDAAHMLGIANPPEEQLEWNLKAMELAERAEDPRVQAWLGPLYNNIGWAYHEMADFDKALATFRKALEWRQAKGHEIETRIAQWTVARCLRSLGRVEAALATQLALEEEWKQSGKESDGYVHEEIGECLLLLNRADEARRYFATAFERLSKDEWLAANEPERLARLKRLRKVE